MNRTVVVIGASSGIGLATARAFAAEGDTVHAAARREIAEPGIAGHTLDFTDHARGGERSPRRSSASTR